MNMSNDFFAKRLAAIEQEKAWRLAAIEEEKTSHAHVNRLNDSDRMLFKQALDQFYGGQADPRTMELLRSAR